MLYDDFLHVDVLFEIYLLRKAKIYICLMLQPENFN